MIKIYGGGEIVPATKEIQAVDDGVLDLTSTVTSWWLDRFPWMGMFNYQIGGLKPIQMTTWMIYEGNSLLNSLTASTNTMFTTGCQAGTPEIFLSTTKPVNSLADLKGLKYRSAGDDGNLFKTMGAAVVSVAPGEIYESLKRGVLDAYQLGSPAIDLTYHMEEVAKYIYISPARQATDYFILGVNKKSWAALPDDLKGILQTAAQEELLYYLSITVIDDNKAVQTFKDKGVQVLPAPQDIVNELIKQADALYAANAAKDATFAQITKSWQAWRTSYNTLLPVGL